MAKDDFDFTEDEMFHALRLAMSEPEAREQAAAFSAAYRPGMNWATSESALLLLSLASDTARTRVERIRRAIQDGRRATWLQQQHDEGRTTPAELARRWDEVIALENEDWARRLSALRRELHGEGKLGGDPEGSG